jgi:hypothetical protein
MAGSGLPIQSPSASRREPHSRTTVSQRDLTAAITNLRQSRLRRRSQATLLLCAQSGNHNVVAGTGVIRRPIRRTWGDRVRLQAGISFDDRVDHSRRWGWAPAMQTYSSVSPRAADGCIARIMRKRDRARLDLIRRAAAFVRRRAARSPRSNHADEIGGTIASASRRSNRYDDGAATVRCGDRVARAVRRQSQLRAAAESRS